MHDWEWPAAAGVEQLGRQMWGHLDATLRRICEQNNVALYADEVEKQCDSLHAGECDLLKLKQRHQRPQIREDACLLFCDQGRLEPGWSQRKVNVKNGLVYD